ncbi:hypothetical protein POSPLADRAFT_1055072 [Postia placenta MAD-698-R-SB12]|uniref:Choline/carnitine acyltransferase domain-containing protein n=1 Tax=Postia placenta MAD-698-R-SB12 TaxID=670580 RepID=A0A1X6N761_9APHY|nr:hypothetical protein POSPLADRAFT_1055072 [Postia placenta MAD-698-R-SB12]OSX64457.1 hypothetical protein POSPLADRAFT_1055072 [Postia placenta MAD-698-R-SB12]
MTPAPRTRPTNWKTLAPAPLPGPAFAAQKSLPQLPVPALGDTVQRLKESLRPLAWNEKEYNESIAKVDHFANNQGEELQRRLLERQAQTQHWLEDWWDDGAYFTYRDSVVVNVSYYYGFVEHPVHLPQTPVHRAASLIRAAMLYRQQLKLGQAEPEKTKEGPICMDTYRWMFDCCRVPGQPADWSVSYAVEGDHGIGGHVVVLRRGRVWKLHPWAGDRLLSVSEIQRQIEHIYTTTQDEHPAVGLLTASNRDTWSKDYDILSSNLENTSVLRDIHSAAFVLCLDTESAPNFIAHSRLLWHGAVPDLSPSVTPSPSQLGLRNRWMDKPLQFVVSDDGKAGFVGEHSIMDGTPTMNMCNHVLDMIASPGFDTPPSANAEQAPQPLDWVVSPEINAAIAEAAKAAYTLATSQEMGAVRTSYGKRAIKAFGVSPDSWAQLVVQLAYERLLRARGERRSGGTYESASTRRFFKGRTEVIRVVSTEALDWVRSMDDPKASLAEKGALFANAARVHVQRAKTAGQGQGADRHLLGLRKSLREGEPLPEMFTDPLITRSSYWVLSTSAINSPHFGPYGWGEVVHDGFGVPYVTGFDDFLQYTVTSRKEMPNAQFCTEIERAAKDLFDLHTAITVQKQHDAKPPKARL